MNLPAAMIEDRAISALYPDRVVDFACAAHESFEFCSPSAKMNMLRAQLAAHRFSADGIGLRLITLEWKYDLPVLSIDLSNWMAKVDRRFRRLSN